MTPKVPQNGPKMTLSDSHNTPQHFLKAAPMPGKKGGENKKNGTKIPGDGPPLLRAPGKKYAVRAKPRTPTLGPLGPRREAP